MDSIAYKFFRIRGRIIVAMALILMGVLLPRPTLANETYTSDEILQLAGEFFGGASEGLASVVEKAFSDMGRPSGFIAGEEMSGAFVFGLRYGQGSFHQKNSKATPVYWRGPSLGWDFGGNVAKVFTLVYNVKSDEQVFQRFPGVDGSFYFIAGFGMNYQRRDPIILAPIRAGLGFRAGANLGYLHYNRERGWLPF